jgi:hypothetical protein
MESGLAINSHVIMRAAGAFQRFRPSDHNVERNAMAYSIVTPEYVYLQIPLTKGLVALVDLDDYGRMSQFRWQANISKDTAYAIGTVSYHGHRSDVRMHRLILNAGPDQKVDHINGNGLDNRKANLRLCSHMQNIWNTTSRTGTSQYKGVSWDISKRIWQATIRYNNKQYHLGRFRDERDAAAAYNKAASQYFGEFAKVNILA